MPRWTEEQRQAQSDRARRLKPWLKSTGPRTKAGKDKAKMNNLRHGLRTETGRELHALLRAQRAYVKMALIAAKTKY